MSEFVSVLLAPPGVLDAREAAPALAEALGMARIDVAQRLRRCVGVPLERVSPEDAERACQVLSDLNVPAVVVGADLVAPWPRPIRARGARLDENELVFLLPGGAERALDWSGEELELLAACCVLDRAEDPVAAGDSGDDVIEAIATVAKRAKMESREPRFQARVNVQRFLEEEEGTLGVRLLLHFDVALTTGEIYRVASDEFEFRCLGDALQPTSTANLVALASELEPRLRCSERVRTDEWRSLAAGKIEQTAFESREDYQAWLRWQLTHAGLLPAEPSAGGGEASP